MAPKATYNSPEDTGVPVVAPLDFTAPSALYNKVGSRVTGKIQAYLDEVHAGMLSGKYSIADAENAFKLVDIQRDQGATGVETGDTGTGTGTGDDAKKTYSEDSRITIKAMLAKYKIPGLFDTIWSAYTGDTLDFTNEDAVTLYIRETPEYKKRFAGNEARRTKGLPDLSIATYIGIEDSYRNTLKANGMPANMYNEENMAELIGGDVDVKEFNDRIGYARDVMMDSPAGVRAQMSELYGITEGQMLAYFVDPERTAPILKEQARGARIGNIAKENARIQLTGAEATDLAKRGITDTEAETAFANISDYRELNTQLSGEETITQSEKIGSELGYDPLGKQKLKNRQKRRVGEFAGGGSFAQSQALGGALKSGVSSAE